MENRTASHNFAPAPAEPALRRRWAEPAIVLERALEVAAQRVGPGSNGPAGGPPNGFLGPLGTSGDKGTCF